MWWPQVKASSGPVSLVAIKSVAAIAVARPSQMGRVLTHLLALAKDVRQHNAEFVWSHDVWLLGKVQRCGCNCVSCYWDYGSMNSSGGCTAPAVCHLPRFCKTRPVTNCTDSYVCGATGMLQQHVVQWGCVHCPHASAWLGPVPGGPCSGPWHALMCVECTTHPRGCSCTSHAHA